MTTQSVPKRGSVGSTFAARAIVVTTRRYRVSVLTVFLAVELNANRDPQSARTQHRVVQHSRHGDGSICCRRIVRGCGRSNP